MARARRYRFTAAVWFSGLLFVPAAAGAQTVPGAAQPGQLNRQLQPAPGLPAQQAPGVTVPELGGTPLSAAAGETPLNLTALEIEGSTVYPAPGLQAMAAPLLNTPITVRALFDLAAAITAKYRSDGYILSRAVVPAQRIDHGVARLRIIEGYVDAITIEGSDSALLKAYAERIKAQRPLRSADLERYLLLANDLPGTQVRAVVTPSKGLAGAADLNFVVTRKQSEFTLGTDNLSSRFFGPYQMFAGATFNGVLGLDERSSVRAGMAFPYREMHYFQAQQDYSLGSDGLVLSINALANIGHPGFTLAPLDPATQGVGTSVRLSYPVIRSRAENWRIWASFDTFDGRSILNNMPTQLPSSNDAIRALRLGTSYDFIDALGGSNFARIEFSQGLAIMGASANDRLNPSRPGGRSDFHKIAADAERMQDLTFLVPHASLYLAATAQTDIDSALLAPEQIGMGGARFGRGYDPSEITGDYGIAGSAELRDTISTPLPVGIAAFLMLQPYVFFDAGVVGGRHPAVTSGGASLASAGLGLRSQLSGTFVADVGLAKPLTRIPEEESLSGRTGKPWHVYFSVSDNF